MIVTTFAGMIVAIFTTSTAMIIVIMNDGGSVDDNDHGSKGSDN